MSAYTRIQVTVEIHGSSYGPEWTIGDIEKQAEKEAISNLERMLKPLDIRIIGKPRVMTHTIINKD